MSSISNQITGKQCRAARGLLGLTMAELAEESGVSVSTIKRLEGSDDAPRGKLVSRALLAALESLGVQSLETGVEAPGEGIAWGAAK